MKLQILNRRSPGGQGKNYVGEMPIEIIRNGMNSPAFIVSKDKNKFIGSCIHCPNTPRINYSPAELVPRFLPSFPTDLSPNVCPADAIFLNEQSGAPTIDQDCISCGLCVQRCPISAISISDKGAVVNDEPNSHFRLTGKPVDPQQVQKISAIFTNLTVKGSMIKDGEAFLPIIYKNIRGTRKPIQFPNLLVRNLMHALCVDWKMRRIGDTNIRMDAVFEWSTGVGAATVEFDENGMLDAPRNILDNCAVLMSRHKVAKNKIYALIVALSFPNLRSEYWRVNQDIKTILGLKIGSISLGALFLIMWEGRKLNHVDPSIFYTDIDSPSIAKPVSLILERSVDENKGYPGWIKASK